MLTATEIFIKHRNSIIKRFQLPEEQFNYEFEQWRLLKGSSDHSIKDFIWSLYNRILAEASKQAENENELYQFQRKVFCEMLMFEIDEGRKIKQSRQQVAWCDLKLAELFPYEVEVFVSAAKDCCPECEEISKKTFTIQEALENIPVPHPLCSKEHYGCRCRIITKSKRDKEGNLIRK